MLLDETTMLGLGDGGAHCSVICDASNPTYVMNHWGRDRTRGEQLQIEWIVKQQTGAPADFFGFSDRGVLAPGKRADINIIDFETLRPRRPEIVYDLPTGGRRFIQRADGYLATLVAGSVTFENGEHTGALPGRLVRAGQTARRAA
jgi:N-acyl-D-aspartate/D-glutamate deacylase